MADLSREEAEYFFQLATNQYAEINLFFYLDKCEYSNFKALCVGIKNSHFITRVAIEQVDKTPIVWGTEVSGYFTVRDVDSVACHFYSKLARIYNAPPNALYLVFPIPSHIDFNQKRYSKRVNLDEDSVAGIDAWHGMIEGGDFEKLPVLRWIKLEQRFCEIAELSASGMRIDFPENSPILEKMALNDEILLRGDFTVAKQPNDVYILGNIVRIMPKPETEGIMSVGVRFRCWRKIASKAGQAWFRADSKDGIGFISQWLSRRFRAVRR